jgi:hypothetical protein
VSAELSVPASDWLPEIEGYVEPERVPNQLVVPSWPEALAPEAFNGLAGEIVSLIEPHSEADPAGLLMHLLVSFGNMVGRAPHFRVGGTTHHANLYCVNVGATASRKGTAKDDTFFVIRTADPEWFGSRVQSGLSSGEGFVWAVRDPIEELQPIRQKNRVVDYQNVITDSGVLDKRLLVVESEFGSTLRVMERDGNTLSAQMRQAWDSGSLRLLTKAKAARATDAHISIIGHITREELLKYLNGTEQANGFANRILWTSVRRSKFLPDGGEIHRLDFTDITRRLREAAQFAGRVGEMRRSAMAGNIWNAVYERLTSDRFGLFGAVTSRAEAQTMRLALVYALLDNSRLIEAEHLSAALAVWSYCEASARLIFGDALGDRDADELLRALRAAPTGLTRTEVSQVFGKNKSSAEINRAFTLLMHQGLVTSDPEESTGGRPTVRWKLATQGTKETK